MARYLITGGAGFIGSHLTEALAGRGETVRVLDNLSTGKEANLAPFRDRIELARGDVRDPDAALRAVRDCDYVLHHAALPSVTRSIEDPATTHDVNVTGTLNLLRASLSAGIRRFVFAGSSSVYGNSPLLPKSETHREDPLSPYAVSKLAGELYCRVFARVHGLPTVVLRYFNVFGPRQDHSSPYSGVIALFISAVLERRAPILYGDGQQSRDFTYVEDVVAANLAACEKEVPGGISINVARGERTSVRELFERIRRIAGVEDLEPERGPARKGDVRHSLADISRMRSLLGVEPGADLEDGLRVTVDWYRSQKSVPSACSAGEATSPGRGAPRP